MDEATQTLDEAQAVVDGATTAAERFVARGHDIITTELGRARALAATYPQVAALLPVIEGTLRSLWGHMTTPPVAVHEPVPETPAPAAPADSSSPAATDGGAPAP